MFAQAARLYLGPGMLEVQRHRLTGLGSPDRPILYPPVRSGCRGTLYGDRTAGEGEGGEGGEKGKERKVHQMEMFFY